MIRVFLGSPDATKRITSHALASTTITDILAPKGAILFVHLVRPHAPRCKAWIVCDDRALGSSPFPENLY